MTKTYLFAEQSFVIAYVTHVRCSKHRLSCTKTKTNFAQRVINDFIVTFL